MAIEPLFPVELRHPTQPLHARERAYAFERSLLAQHTFACALTTRGALCDCQPPPVDLAPLSA